MDSKINGKNFKMILELIKEAQNGKVVMFVSPKGNVVILDWKKYDKLVKKTKPKN